MAMFCEGTRGSEAARQRGGRGARGMEGERVSRTPAGQRAGPGMGAAARRGCRGQAWVPQPRRANACLQVRMAHRFVAVRALLVDEVELDPRHLGPCGGSLRVLGSAERLDGVVEELTEEQPRWNLAALLGVVRLAPRHHPVVRLVEDLVRYLVLERLIWQAKHEQVVVLAGPAHRFALGVENGPSRPTVEFREHVLQATVRAEVPAQSLDVALDGRRAQWDFELCTLWVGLDHHFDADLRRHIYAGGRVSPCAVWWWRA